MTPHAMQALDQLFIEMTKAAESVPEESSYRVHELRSSLSSWASDHGDEARAVIVLEALHIMQTLRSVQRG